MNAWRTLVLVVWLTGSMLPTAGTAADDPPITDVAFSPDGRYLVCVGQSGIVSRRWPDLETVAAIQVPLDNLHCAAFSPDGDHLAVGGGNPADFGAVVTLKWSEGALDETIVHQYRQFDDSVVDVRWTGNNSWLAASIDRTVRHVHLNQSEATVMQGHSRAVTAVETFGQTKWILSGGDDHRLRLWDTADFETVRTLKQHTGPIVDIAAARTNDGLPIVATASEDRTVRLWQPTIGRLIRFCRLPQQPLKIAWSPDSQTIVAACRDGNLRWIDVASVQVVHTRQAIDGWAYAIAIHPSEPTIVVAGSGGKIQPFPLDHP
ncbi:WD40 repeat domain-containing protein [Crateriforma conspicua]|uniref:WD domain, G-beta repeat n=1 Tax=Crateriforma conspicua TaxID=2527996 RepID=A0A5C5Y4R6_9PLAN|nr:hypothetical protein [Crateriforma conspicua]TWT69305.1 WD domain, G-beta repeat [Crateriforma conspicua]